MRRFSSEVYRRGDRNCLRCGKRPTSENPVVWMRYERPAPDDWPGAVCGEILDAIQIHVKCFEEIVAKSKTTPKRRGGRMSNWNEAEQGTPSEFDQERAETEFAEQDPDSFWHLPEEQNREGK